MESIENAIEQLNKEQYIPRSVEFTVQEDFMKNLPDIVSNLAEVKKWAEEQTKYDREMVLVSDADFENAKARSTDLNKKITQIENKRKEIKREYNRPYEIFDKAAKDVVMVLSAARENLWGQIQKQESEKKLKLENEYRHYYETTAEEKGVLKYRSWKQIFNEKWLNKTTKADTVLEAINGIIETTKNELTAIKALNSEFELALLQRYTEGHTMTDIITYDSRLKAEKQAVETQKQVVETQKQVVKENTQPHTEKAEITPKDEPTSEIEEVFATDFRVWTTKDQLMALGKWLRENGIKYGKVE